MKISIVIVNWNTGELLANCLQSLLNLDLVERSIIEKVWVIDNASSDDSMKRAQTTVASHTNKLPFEFITNEYNVGFATANNQALKIIAQTGTAHALLLNPDTEVRPGALSAMFNVLEQDSTVGIVGPRLLNPDGSGQGSVRPFPGFGDFVLYMLKLGRFIQARQEGYHDYTKGGYVDQVMGAAFLIRHSLLQTVGLLDEGFFTLFEEVDFAKRARDDGWRSFYTPEGTVMHVRAASFNQLVGFKRSLPWLKSSLYYAHKHLPAWQVLILYALVPVCLVLVIPASVKHLILKYAR